MTIRRILAHPLSRLLLTGVTLATLAGCGDDDHFGEANPPLRILVTNDDGIGAEGIDALVEALVADPRNEVTVCAPNGNRSGTTDMTGPSARCGDLAVTAGSTLGGYPGTAMNGCPADTVLYALANLYPADAPPHVVLSGINEGQNVSLPIATRVSGTVGAARTAGRNGIPALAVSQGSPAPGGAYAYDVAVDTTLDWIDDHRAALQAGGTPPDTIDSINVPSCAPGLEVRGILAGLPLATLGNGAFDSQDCASTLMDPRDDVEAFRNGFITRTTVALENG
jgi:5'-nucleotidase